RRTLRGREVYDYPPAPVSGVGIVRTTLDPEAVSVESDAQPLTKGNTDTAGVRTLSSEGVRKAIGDRLAELRGRLDPLDELRHGDRVIELLTPAAEERPPPGMCIVEFPIDLLAV